MCQKYNKHVVIQISLIILVGIVKLLCFKCYSVFLFVDAYCTIYTLLYCDLHVENIRITSFEIEQFNEEHRSDKILSKCRKVLLREQPKTLIRIPHIVCIDISKNSNIIDNKLKHGKDHSNLLFQVRNYKSVKSTIFKEISFQNNKFPKLYIIIYK